MKVDKTQIIETPFGSFEIKSMPMSKHSEFRLMQILQQEHELNEPHLNIRLKAAIRAWDGIRQ